MSYRLSATQISAALRAGVPGGRLREMQQDCTREEYLAEVAAAKKTLTTIKMSDGSKVKVTPDVAPKIVGVDVNGYLVMTAWENYNIALTPCCHGAVSCDDHGNTYCKGCYRYADSYHGMEATDPLAATRV